MSELSPLYDMIMEVTHDGKLVRGEVAGVGTDGRIMLRLNMDKGFTYAGPFSSGEYRPVKYLTMPSSTLEAIKRMIKDVIADQGSWTPLLIDRLNHAIELIDRSRDEIKAVENGEYMDLAEPRPAGAL